MPRRRSCRCRADVAAPQHRAHARGELAQTERLGDVVVGADVEPGHAIALARARREHDDRHACGARPRAEDAADFESAQHRQIEVEDDQIRRALGDRLQRFVAGPDDLDVDVAALSRLCLISPAMSCSSSTTSTACAQLRRRGSCLVAGACRIRDVWHPYSKFHGADSCGKKQGFLVVTRELNLGYGAGSLARPRSGSIHG